MSLCCSLALSGDSLGPARGEAEASEDILEGTRGLDILEWTRGLDILEWTARGGVEASETDRRRKFRGRVWNEDCTMSGGCDQEGAW